MVAKTDPFLGLGYGDPLGTSNWNVWMDENLVVLGTIINITVNSATTATPQPIVNGERWIIPSGATGAWSTNIGKIACAVEGAYRYVSPVQGMRVTVADTGTLLAYIGSAWSDEDDYGTL